MRTRPRKDRVTVKCAGDDDMQGKEKVRECNVHQGGHDLFSFFMFEAWGDSEVDFPDDPIVEGPCYRHCYPGHETSGPLGEAADDDAESCVLGSSSDYSSLQDTGDPHEEINEAEELADNDRQQSLRDLQATTTTSADQDHHEFVSDCWITHKDHPYHDDPAKSCLSDDSSSKNRLNHRYCEAMKRKEKDKLFWEACLASS